MDTLRQTYAQLLEQWKKLPSRGQLGIGVVAALGVLAAIVLLVMSREPKQVLFSGLDPRDAASVVGALDGAKIDYELGAGGTAIRVPASDIDRARLLLAEQDLPASGSVGFEMFEEQSFGLTDFAQQVNYRRALQGELERTISAIDAVASARVHVTQPRKAVFEDEVIEPTAAVTVKLVQGRRLNDRHVGAIRHLVASAVEGLEASQVTIVDSKGNLLSRGGLENDAAIAALDYESDLERDLERKLTRLLERTVGVGGAEVRVAAEVDFSRTDTTEEVFDPEQLTVRTESTQQIIEGTGANRPGGVAGAQANVPGGPAAGTQAGANDSSRVTTSKNYEVNRTVVHTQGPGATLKRLTVAVLVDGTYTPPEDGSDPVFAPRSDEEIAQLQSIVENAIGFNAARGDSIKIASVPFRDRPGFDDLGTANASTMPTWMPIALGGAVLAIAGLAWFVISRRRQRPIEPELLSGTTVRQAQAALARAEGDAAAADVLGALPPGTQLELPKSRDEVLELAAADPERTADIIRAWILHDMAL